MARENKVSILYQIKDVASAGIKKLEKNLKNLTKAGFNRAKTAVTSFGKTLISIGKKGLIGLAGAFATAGFASAKAAGKMEQWKLAFETMLGSASEADKLLRKITKFAASTPFELPGLIDSSKQLLAFGIESEKIIPTMKSLGDIAAGVGTDKLPTLVRAFGKIKTKGKATMEELNMLLEAGVPILDELAQGYGVTSEELFKMVSRGQVGFSEVDAALKRMTTGNGQFADLMEKQSESFFGIISNIKDNITQAAMAIGAEMLPALKKIAEQIKAFTSTDRLPAFIKNLKTWFIDIKTITQISMETVKELIASPFRWETYKTIFQGLGSGIKRFFGALKQGYSGVKEFLAQVRAEEQQESKSLEEEIQEIRQKAANEKLRIEQEYQKKLKSIKDQEIEFEKEKNEALQEEALLQKEAKLEQLTTDLAEEEALKRDSYNKMMALAGEAAAKHIKAEEDKKNAAIQALKERLKAEVATADTIDGVAKGLGRSLLDTIKKTLIESLLGKQFEAIADIGISIAKHLASLNFAGAAMAATQLPVPVAQAAVGVAAINQIKFANGGLVEPSPGGVNVIMGEAGKRELGLPSDKVDAFLEEADIRRNSEIVIHNHLMVDGEEVARNTTRHQQQFSRTREF